MDNVTTGTGRTPGRSGFATLLSTPLLVGRTLEQIFLREELAAVLGGRGRLVLLGGEAGIGKTTLARDLADEAAARGVHVLTGACYDLTNTPPYGPWLDLFDACEPRPRSAGASGRLCRTGGWRRVTDQAALFAEVRRILRRAQPPPARPSSCSKTSIGPIPPAWNSSGTLPPACGTGRSCCSSPIGATS